MFGPPGFAYTHFVHMHCLINVVSGQLGRPEAVLFRSIEPYTGIDLMYERRGKPIPIRELANDPGKLTKSLGIVFGDYGKLLFERPLYIAEGRKIEAISAVPRIGIENSGEARHYPWRYWEKDSPYVPRKKMKWG